MLKEILSISGKPGLYRLLKYGKNNVIIENVTDKKRTIASAREKIISLGDIAIYTVNEEVPLGEVMEKIYAKFNGSKLDVANYKTNDDYAEFMKSVLPDYDTERVYMTDVKKLVNWYNVLVDAGFTSFKSEEKPEEESEKKSE